MVSIRSLRFVVDIIRFILCYVTASSNWAPEGAKSFFFFALGGSEKASKQAVPLFLRQAN